MSIAKLLSLIGRIRPEIWDAIVPHAPLVRSPTDSAFLNPQPLPPAEAFLLTAAQMSHQVVRVAVEAEVRGESSVGFVREFIDDWCGTPWPRKWPSPWPGPRPGEGPSPLPWDVASARIIGSIVFASVGSRLPGDGELGVAFSEGAERLAESAVSV